MKKLLLLFSRFIIVFIVTILLFTMIGLMTTAKPSSRLTSLFFSNWTSNIDQSIFSFMYGAENKAFLLMKQGDDPKLRTASIFSPLFKSTRLTDFKNFLGKELPGFSTYEQTIIIASEQAEEMTSLFHESGPPIEDILEDREAVFDEQIKDEKSEISLDKKVVFLYSSHNRESFLPHLPKETTPNRAYHKEVNITKVSERLAKKLEDEKIGTAVDTSDITTILHEKGWSYGKSYDASRPVVQEAFKQHKDLQYVFDIHRDSLPYGKTTIEVDDKTYATFLFVIGAENKQYEKNLALATKLHYRLEEVMPGISRGVITKEGPLSNGVYNQDLMENALLIEVGGYDNHLDEMYRSIDLFATVFSDYYWEAEKVNN